MTDATTLRTTPPKQAVKLSAGEIRARKGGPKLVMVTAYDYPTARRVEAAGLDLILVGDSLGMVVLGYASTVPVTMEEMIHHTRATVRGAPHVHVVADLPFGSYQTSDEQAVENSARLIKEGGADSVKLEGGGEAMVSRIRAIVAAGIPVMGHVGLTPQSTGGGGFKVQGRELEPALAILADARAVAEAGVYGTVLEAVPSELSEQITARLPIPTIGIGAGAACDGQVLVSHDLLGLEDRYTPKFGRRYAELGRATEEAFAAYAAEVRDGAFPTPAYSYGMNPEVAAALREALGD